MCTQLNDHCAVCFKGYNPNVPTSKRFYGNQLDRIAVRDRECCTMCDPLPKEKLPEGLKEGTTAFQVKEHLYTQGLDLHNPCGLCGKRDRCGLQVKKGYT